ncbi:hypothetical protein ACFSKL_16825 [Belliella marina]|uniref:Uncharacterized protein n=1 Tax=Belliella marina TaxID=1644146 RepID=A0ABW4VQE2_9BACT
MKKYFVLFLLSICFTAAKAQDNHVVKQTYTHSMPSNVTYNYEFTNNGYFNYILSFPTYPGVHNAFGDGGVTLYDWGAHMELSNEDFNYPDNHYYSHSMTLQGSVYIGTETRDCELQMDFTIPTPYGTWDEGRLHLSIEIYP